MGKGIRYTNHAIAAMTERQIDRLWVERTIGEPQWREPDPVDSEVTRLFRSIPERGGRYLRVACVETATEFRILSVFLDRRARPK